MMEVYFDWPPRGNVYEVPEDAVSLGRIVRLPDGTELQLLRNEEGYLEVRETSSRNRNAAQIHEAVYIFDPASRETEMTVNGDGNWDAAVRLLNAAAAVNTLATIYLSPTEYAWQSADDMATLKAKLSPRAQCLIVLHESHYLDFEYNPGRPAIELLRTGRCPH